MAQIAEINSSILDDDDGNYLYKKDEYVEEGEGESLDGAVSKAAPEKKEPKLTDDGYEIPDFLDESGDDIIKIS
jgi:hypothetical protein